MRTNMLISGVVLTSLCATTLAAPPDYIVKDLGTLSGPDTKWEPGSVGLGIAAGAMVGYAVTTLPHRNFHGFRFQNGVMSDLDVLPDDEHSIAFSINSAGDAVGISYKLGELTMHGVRWPAAGGAISLGNVEPREINAAGAIAGSKPVNGALGTSHATLIVGNAVTDLGTLGGASSMAFALNASNWVVGQSQLANATTHPFVYRGTSMLDLGTLGGTSGRALDINGQWVVGISDLANGTPHATLWSLTVDGNLASKSDLGAITPTAVSAATCINMYGVIVGNSDDNACLWDGGIINLNTRIDPNAGWHLTRANAIDGAGRIVGVGKHFGLQRAFELIKRAPADFNADGSVGPADLALFLGAWGGSDLAFDLDGDGAVGGSDLAMLLGAWSA